jgi:outer membrane protein assembly factor BamB
MKKTLILLFLVSLSFSSLLGQFSTNGEVTGKPIIYQGSVVVASDDGNIYALNPSTMALSWKSLIGKEPNEVFVFDNGVIASITSGKVVKVGPGGSLLWSLDLNTTEYNVSYIYGASANQKNIFVSANNGIYVLEKNGTVKGKIASFEDAIVTAPAAGADYVVYGKGNGLFKISETGQLRWTAALDEGSFWLSRPVLAGGVIYIGALDDKLHAYVDNTGFEVWSVKTRNWVASTPLVEGGMVYFGSNDGRVYAVDSGTGNVEWEAQTQLAVQTEPESGSMGGEPVIFIGGSDKSIYAISKESGEIVWKGSAAGGVGSPLFYLNSVIFGSQDRRVYSYSTERACSITEPLEADIVGLKELVVKGKYVSQAGGASVQININTAGWEETESTAVDWLYYLDPSEKLIPGLNRISCKVRDSSGEETGTMFTTVAINHDPNRPLSGLVVTVSPSIIEDEEFTVYVNDGDDGSPVERFTLVLNEDTYEGSGNVSLTISEPGTYEATAKKMGFKDETVNITVSSSGVSPLYLVGGILLIAVIVWFVWTRFLRQRFTKKK